MYVLTSKKFFEAAGLPDPKAQLLVEDSEGKDYKPKGGFLTDKPIKRVTKKSDTLKNIEKQVKKNAKKSMTMKEYLQFAGVDVTQGKAKRLIEGNNYGMGDADVPTLADMFQTIELKLEKIDPSLTNDIRGVLEAYTDAYELADVQACGDLQRQLTRLVSEALKKVPLPPGWS